MKDDARSAEIPVRENKRGNEGPKVKPEAQPAGTHLHPNSWHSALHDLGVGFWSVGGQSEKQQFSLHQLNLPHVWKFIHTSSTYMNWSQKKEKTKILWWWVRFI